MTVPTEQEMVDEYATRFPNCRLTLTERDFLTTVHLLRKRGIGYGWMRQAVGLAWKLEDPIGYMDDDRLLDLYDVDRTLTTTKRKTPSTDAVRVKQLEDVMRRIKEIHTRWYMGRSAAALPAVRSACKALSEIEAILAEVMS